MAQALSLRQCAATRGSKELFRDLDLSIDVGDRLALVGANGNGKSTLMDIMAGRQMADEGERHLQRGTQIAIVDQEPVFPEGSTVRSVLEGVLDGVGVPGHEQQSQIARIVQAFGFTNLDQDLATMSGGWQRRVALAAAFIVNPDILFLDEPTNHLDLGAILDLEERLRSFPGTVVLVSHDRWFLDRVATRVTEIAPVYRQGYFTAPGGYSAFLDQREQFLAGQQAEQEALANKMRREEAWLARQPKARTTKNVARIKRAAELRDDLQAVKVRNRGDQTAAVRFSASGRQANDLVLCEQVSKAFGEHCCFRSVDQQVSAGDRIALLGANGAGKSTFLKLLAGEHEPDSGTIKRAHGLRAVTFAQTRSGLDPEATVMKTLAPEGDQVFYNGTPWHVRAWAARFRFSPEQLQQRVGSLSGGEQARLLIAVLVTQSADVLLLDEPTNDLDIPALDMLEEALAAFAGAVVLITHDRFLLQRLCDRFLYFDGLGGTQLLTGIEHFERMLQSGSASEVDQAAADTHEEHHTAGPGLSWDEQKELRGLPGRIEKAEAKLEELAAKLGDPSVYNDAGLFAEAQQAVDAKQSDINDLYSRWEDLSERDEA